MICDFENSDGDGPPPRPRQGALTCDRLQRRLLSMTRAARTLQELFELEIIGVHKGDLKEQQFRSRFAPAASGDAGSHQAYGGCTIATAVVAAGNTVPHDFKIYSALGNFLGPATTDASLRLVVQTTRSTTSFCSRYVQVFQQVPASRQKRRHLTERQVLAVLVDFNKPFPTSLFEYSAKPTSTLSPEDPSLLHMDHVFTHVWPPEVTRKYKAWYADHYRFFEQRALPDSPHAYNAHGIWKDRPQSKQTTHFDPSDLTNKHIAVWAKCRTELDGHLQHAAATW